MKKIMKNAFVMIAVAAMVFAFVSCGGSKSSSAGSSAPASAPVKPAESIANTAVSTESVAATSELTDQTINIGYGTAIDSLTPFRSNTARNAPYMVNLYETLGVMTEDIEVIPYAAKGWKTEDNGKSYEIEIYDNITDSAGNKITAKDIVWFISESKARALKPIFARVVSVEATGEYTLKVEFKSNVYGSFQTLMVDTFVVSEKAFKESADEFGTMAVTTSPYKVTGFVPSASLNFERRADYWQKIEDMPECVRPIQKNVNYKIIKEASQLGIALETGDVDAAVDIASSTGTQFVGKDGYTIDLSDGPQGWQVFFSGGENRIIANNLALRQAICYAINEAGMVQAIAGGYGTQMWDTSSPRLLGFNPDWRKEPYYQFDLEKAKQLVKESGYNGEELVLLSTSSATASRLGQMIQNFCQAAGIKVKINAVDMALFSATRLDGTQYDMVIVTVGGMSLPDFWSIRFDPAAYTNGDATSRKDMKLAELLYKTWTTDGFTKENINEVHNYIKDNAIAYGIVNPSVFTIWSNKLNMTKVVKGGLSGYVMFGSCQIKK